jgi:ubiquinone/menaquinone biosynthesis C-methylase UbiE
MAAWRRRGEFSVTPVHRAALDGFSKEARAYARGRPAYPDALVEWLCKQLRLGPGKTAVDLGAGTGKFTRLMLRSGAKIAAVEPIEAMREQLVESLPDVTAISGAAESIPLGTGSVDAVVCAQAFHWFASHAALEEIHRVLVPGGALGLVWNVRDESCDWVAAITEIITPYEADAPRFHTGQWRQAFTGDLFSEPQSFTFQYQHVGTPQETIIDRFLSVSFIAALPAPEKARVKGRLQALIDTWPQLKGRTEIAFPYQTRAYHYVRR